MITIDGYGRVSPRPEQKRDNCASLDVQRDSWLRYCQHIGAEPGVWLQDEFVSGGDPLPSRLSGNLLLQRVDNGTRHIAVMALDRIFRDPPDGERWLAEWERKGVTLHLVNQGGVSANWGTAAGKLVMRTLLTMAAFERDQTKERTSNGMQARQRNGQRQGRRDRLPFGVEEDPDSPMMYDDDSKEVGRRDTRPCEVEQRAIAVIKTLNNKGYGPDRIAQHMRDNGHTHRTQPWTAKLVKRVLHRYYESAESNNQQRG